MSRYSTFLESSRPSWLARCLLRIADAYVSLRYPGQRWPSRKSMYEGTPSRWVYRRNGLAYLDHLKDLAGLTPASRVFDIGCGLGRKTWPLVNYFDSGEYLGVEPRQDAVEWCQQNLSALDDKLVFRHLDVWNGYYTPGGIGNPSTMTFPAGDGCYDIVMANSVFTHMLPDQIGRYLAESARILTTDGRLFATFFLDPDDPITLGPINDPPRYTFPHQRAGYRVQHADCDEHVVNYREVDVRDMCEAAGIRVVDIKWGSWRGNTDFVDFQDIVIGEKR